MAVSYAVHRRQLELDAAHLLHPFSDPTIGGAVAEDLFVEGEGSYLVNAEGDPAVRRERRAVVRQRRLRARGNDPSDHRTTEPAVLCANVRADILHPGHRAGGQAR